MKRGVLCVLQAEKYGHRSQKFFDACNRLFGKPTYLLDFTKQREWQAWREAYLAKQKPQVDSHEACLDARDYEGCIRVKSGNAASPRQDLQDSCSGDICTVTTRGTDIFGLPKPMGWRYHQYDQGIMYWSQPGRIPHNSQETRYLGITIIHRYYRNPKAGTSGSFIGGNTASTSCKNIGSSVNCTTIGSSPYYVPGSSATPGGLRSIKYTSVYDCKDNTFADYKYGKLWGKWGKWGKDEPLSLSSGLKTVCDRGDKHIKKNMRIIDLKL